MSNKLKMFSIVRHGYPYENERNNNRRRGDDMMLSLFGEDDDLWNNEWRQPQNLALQMQHNNARIMKLDIKENEKEYEIIADVPGVKKDNLSVDVKNNVLTISAERSGGEEVKKGGFMRVERYFGHMSRSFALPENVMADKIDAELVNGVLHVRLPKLAIEDGKKTEWKIDVKHNNTPSESSTATSAGAAAKNDDEGCEVVYKE